MVYTTYWSILDSPSNTIEPKNIALIVALLAGGCWILIKKFRKDEEDKSILLWGTAIFGVLGIAMYMLLFIYPDNSRAEIKEKLDSSHQKVEGRVSNFQRRIRHARSRGETIESFTVDSVHFAYGDTFLGKFSEFTEIYNNVIYNGQAVRITYNIGSPYGDDFNSIARIEIGR